MELPFQIDDNGFRKDNFLKPYNETITAKEDAEKIADLCKDTKAPFEDR